MLQELYRYALSHNLAARPGFKPKSVKAYILLSADGQFLGFSPALEKKTICPDIGSAAQGTTKCNILTEKAAIVLLLEEKQAVKHRFFLDALRSGAQAEPRFGICLHALEHERTLEKMRQALGQTKLKPGDVIGFEVDGSRIEQSPAYFDWWEGFRKEQTADKAGRSQSGLPRCLITGEPSKPLTTVPKVGGLRSVGGHPSGDALLCFDKQAFCSYDLKQGDNAAVSEEAMTAVNAALETLIGRAPTQCGAKIVYWFKEKLPKNCNLLDELFGWTGDEEEAPSEEAPNPSDELDALRAARQLIESAKAGENPQQLYNRYYILALSGAGGRVMIRSYIQGDFEELYKSLKAWFDDLRLTLPNGGGRCKPPKLFALNVRLLKKENSSKKLLERMEKELAGVEPHIWFSIVKNKPLPDTSAVRALAYIRSGMLESAAEDSRRESIPDSVACQLLKAWLLRVQRQKKEKETIMETLNMQNSSAAYQAGRMMAVFAAIQSEAMGPNLGAGVIQRYYASASATPALVIGTLSKLSQYHLGKIENKSYAKRFDGMLNEIAQTVGLYCEGNRFPDTLTLAQQAEFALGYYQQRAEIYTKKEKPAGNPETDTDNKD